MQYKTNSQAMQNIVKVHVQTYKTIPPLKIHAHTDEA